MSDMAMEAVAPTGAPVSGASSRWRRHLLALGLVVVALLALFGRDAADIVTIWWLDSIYEHCLVILPLIGWLVWQRLPVLREATPAGWTLPLAWVALGAFGWLIGEAAGVAVPRHIGLLMMLQGAIAAVLGRGLTAGLLFPLFYAAFLMPFGDAVVPALQTLTARMCMALLHLTRIPATIDGVFIETPAGWFKVAEACSGAKFLIAMVALGALVAHLGFYSWRKRLGFMALCVVVPILANGLRAFGTIWVAEWTGAKAAGSFDHIVYGWIFFGTVIAAVLAISWRYFDRPADSPAIDAAVIARQAGLQRTEAPLLPVSLAVLAIAAAGPLWSAVVQARGTVPIAVAAHLPEVPGWSRIPATGGVPWKPRFDGADRLLTARYRDAAGAEVDLSAVFYASQGEGKTLVGFAHGAVDPKSTWSWAADLPAPAKAHAERIISESKVVRIVVSFYRVGDESTGSPPRVKLETLRHHLLGGRQDAAALLVSAPLDKGGEAAIGRFLAALGAPGPLLDRIAAGR